MAIDYKNEVLNFFDKHILKYIVTDLKVLDSISANKDGVGACSIPQAMATFAAIDLIWYLIDHNDIGNNIVNMRMMPFLKSSILLPELQIKDDMNNGYLNAIRDDIRSVATHRFALINFDIGKFPDDVLFILTNGRQVLNVSYLTKIVLLGINRLYELIKSNQFHMHEKEDNDTAIRRFYNRIELLKSHGSDNLPMLTSLKEGIQYGSTINTTTNQTTQSLG